MTKTSANCLTWKTVLFSPKRFMLLTHTSSESFTVQHSMSVFIPQGILNFTFRNKPTDLRIGITKPRGNAYSGQK